MITLKITRALYLRVYLEANKAAVEKDDIVVNLAKSEIEPLITALELAKFCLENESEQRPEDGTP